MANIKSAIKRARQNDKIRVHNASLRSKFRTFLKKVISAIDAKDKKEAQKAYNEAVPVIDGMASKNIITSNKAARHKSRLSKHIKALAE